MEEERSRGVLSKFNDVEGIGFITPDDDDGGAGDDLLFHISEAAGGYGTPKEGQVVEFLVTLDGDQIKAVDITGPGRGPLDRNEIRCSSYGGGVDVTGGPDRGPLDRNRGRWSSYRGRGRDGGYGNYGGGRRNESEYLRSSGGTDVKCCNNCGRTGHLANDCDLFFIRNIDGGGECYECGKTGHLTKDCNTIVKSCGGPRGDGGGRTGHLAKDCSSNVRGVFSKSAGEIYNSGRTGIVSGECYNCGRTGHLAKDCGRNVRGGKSSGGSYSSGRTVKGSGDYLANDCGSNFKDGECYYCEKTGHLARDCDSIVRRGGGGGGGGSGDGGSGDGGSGGGGFRRGYGHLARDSIGRGNRFSSRGGENTCCFKCGRLGHLARYCKQSSCSEEGWSNNSGGRMCFKCGEFGHFAKDCSIVL